MTLYRKEQKMYQINTRKLQCKIVEAGTTQEAIAKDLGIDRGTFRRRLVSGRLQIRDIHKICEVLSLSRDECYQIFLSE